MKTDDYLEDLVRRAQGADVPPVDVRVRVRTTLRELAPEAPGLFDRPTLAFAGLSLAIVATMFSVSLPALNMLRDPFAAYMISPWSF